MRRIPGVSLGTYFAKGAEGGRQSADTSPMRGLVYLVKNNRPDKPVQPQLINHPRHPGKRPVLVNLDGAPGYVAEVILGNLTKIRESLGVHKKERLAIVPIPSSSVTKETIDSDRWPALKVAMALEHGGAGSACPVVVNRRPSTPKTKGRRLTVDELQQLLVRVGDLPPGHVVFVDDVIDDGNHVAAVDTALARPASAGIVVVGLSDATAVDSCYRPRWYTVVYDEAATPLRPYVERRAPVDPAAG